MFHPVASDSQRFCDRATDHARPGYPYAMRVHRCLIPQEDNAWFCPECGSAVGPYNNYMPFVVVFSKGEVLRAGVNDKFRPSFFIVCGFVVYALTQYAVFAPIYWYFMYQNFRRNLGDAGSENVKES
jgi:hypothetical protein